MTNYCLLNEAKDEILEGPKPLPVNWKHISNLPALPDVELKVLNWLPCEYPELVFNPATEKRLPDTYDIQEDKVLFIFNIEDKTQEELDAEAAATAEAEATAYIQQRQDAHISIGDQLDMQYWDLVNDTTIWKDYVTVIKEQFPKPE